MKNIRNQSPAVLGFLLKPEAVMDLLGYKARKAFLAMCRRKGLRYVQINARVIRFDPAVVEEWIKRRQA